MSTYMRNLLSTPTDIATALGLSFVAYILAVGVYNYLLSPLRKVPGPTLARFTRLREVYQNTRHGYHYQLIDLHKKYGPVVRFGPNYYSFNRKEDWEKIYDLKTKWIKTSWYKAGMPDLKKPSIFTMTDEKLHAERKRKIAGLYSMSTMVHYEPAVDRSNEVFLRRMNELAEKHGDKYNSKPFDLPAFVQYFAFDVVSQITFDQDFHLMETGADPEGVLAAIRRILYTLAILGPMPEIFRGMMIALNFISRFIKSDLNQGVSRIRASIESQAEVYRRQTGIDKPVTEKSEPFLAKLIGLAAGGKFGTEEEFKDSLFDSCAANLVAGSDTTGIAIAAFVWYIYHAPEKLARLRAEIEAVQTSTISFAQAQGMPYLNAVLKETFRLHPPIGNIYPRLVPRGGVELGGYWFPEGVHVGVSPWPLHYNPEVSGPDADVFRPERWLDGPEGDNLDNEAKAAMSFTFGGGSRTCIGKNIAMLEITKNVPEIVKNFDFEFAQDKFWLETAGMTWPHYDVWIRKRQVAKGP